jgi:exodeoxyribonuclease V beta subunit
MAGRWRRSRSTTSAPPARADEVRRALYEACADEIARLVSDPAHRIVGTARGKTRTLGAGDIYVLTRTNAESTRGRRRHPRARRAVRVPAGRAPVRDPGGPDVADLLDAVAHPRDRQAQMRAWMTCFFDVRARHAGRAKDAPDDHPLVAHFHDWRGLAARLDYPRLFRSILDDTRVIERALATGGGTRTVTNLGHVLEHLYAEVERSRCELPELVGRLRAWIADGAIAPTTATAAPGDRSARGAGHDRAPRQGPRGLGRVPGRRHRLHSPRPTTSRSSTTPRVSASRCCAAPTSPAGPSGQEDQRLAYVALTRARARLYLPVLPQKNKKPSPRGGWLGIYGALHDAVNDLHATGRRGPGVAPAAPTPLPANVIAFPVVATGAPEVDDWPAARPPGALLDATAVAIPPPPATPPEPGPLGARTGFVVTSYSRLKKTAAGAVGGAELDVTTVTGEDRSRRAPGPDELPGGASTGQLLHAVLEDANLAIAAAAPSWEPWLERAEVAALFADAERRSASIRAGGPRPRRWRGGRSSRRWSPAARDLRHPGQRHAVAREVEFVYPIPDAPLADSGEYLTARADRAGPRGFIKGFIDAIVAWDDRCG